MSAPFVPGLHNNAKGYAECSSDERTRQYNSSVYISKGANCHFHLPRLLPHPSLACYQNMNTSACMQRNRKYRKIQKLLIFPWTATGKKAQIFQVLRRLLAFTFTLPLPTSPSQTPRFDSDFCCKVWWPIHKWKLGAFTMCGLSELQSDLRISLWQTSPSPSPFGHHDATLEIPWLAVNVQMDSPASWYVAALHWLLNRHRARCPLSLPVSIGWMAGETENHLWGFSGRNKRQKSDADRLALLMKNCINILLQRKSQWWSLGSRIFGNVLD